MFIYKSDADEFRPNDIIRRIFVTQNDVKTVNDVRIKFTKKAKPLVGTDPNALGLKFADISVESVELKTTYILYYLTIFSLILKSLL